LAGGVHCFCWCGNVYFHSPIVADQKKTGNPPVQITFVY
jgi:hypothetical protein